MDEHRREAGASGAFRAVIPPMRPLLYLFVLLTLLSTVLLFILSGETETLFAWTIQPSLSAAFLGAGYASGFVLIVLTMRERAWANLRIAFVTVLWFVTFSLIATLAHLDRFHFDSPHLTAQIAAFLWLGVYLVTPVWMAVLLYLQTRAPGVDPPIHRRIAGWARIVLAFQGAVMIPVGVMLVIAPAWVEGWWPWELTPLVGRAVGAWVFALGWASLQAIWERDLRRLHSASATFIVLAVLQLAALLRFTGEVRWEEPATWIYLAVLAGMGTTGVYGRLAGATDVPAPARASS